MGKLNFVDANLNQLTEADDKTERFAIDLGIDTHFGGKWLLGAEHTHCFVGAKPWLTWGDRDAAYAFCRKLEELNPGVEFGLLYLEQIELFNRLGENQDFEILNCRMQNTDDDWHGCVDGYYSLRRGRLVSDWGENKTNVYFVFGFVQGEERVIVMP